MLPPAAPINYGFELESTSVLLPLVLYFLFQETRHFFRQLMPEQQHLIDGRFSV